ncbi:MAG: FKBP-type peptidyl-prolyl cis-trans isomerase [Flavobacteriales bacterium]
MKKSSLGILALAALAAGIAHPACAQKNGKVELKSLNDSLSYGIGSQIGTNVRGDLARAGLGGLNMKLIQAGFRDGSDSTMQASAEALDAVLRDYMMKHQQEQQERETAAAEANLKAGQAWLAENGKRKGVVTTSTGLQYEVIIPGSGAMPTADSQVEVNYRGTLTNGLEFDSSYKRGQSANFGLNQVIPGWTEVLQLMSEGAKWKVYIPSELAYGARGNGQNIPGNSVLVFDLELLKVLSNSKPGTAK